MIEDLNKEAQLNTKSLEQTKLIKEAYSRFDSSPHTLDIQELTAEKVSAFDCLVDSEGNIEGLSFSEGLSDDESSINLLKVLLSLDLPLLKSLAFFGFNENLIEVVSHFPSITHLTIVNSSFEIKNLDQISKLKNIKMLNLTRTNLLSISGINNLINIENIYLGGTRINCLDNIKYLTKLKTIACWETGVVDLSPLSFNLNLEEIYCQDNDVSTLEPLTILEKLKVISAVNCNISSVSEQILKLGLPIVIEDDFNVENQAELNLHGNPITFPPKEILSRGNEVIQAYFDSLYGEQGKLNEAKLILVGEGAAGKTSLIKRFIDNTFDPREDKTDGISIKPWTVQAHEENETIKVHCWDFGGQEIMRATHQLFLSERSVYLIVLNIRKDENPEHWLKQVMAVSKHSPIIIILNKCDEQFDDNIAKQMLREKYPNICAFHKVSCLKNTGIEKLKKDVIKEISKLGMRQFMIAQNWLKVKQELEKLKSEADYINYQKFIEVCKKYAITSPMVQDIVLTLLHDLGLVIHFKELEELQTQVLNPKWITEGIYTLINSDKLSIKHGIISKNEAEEILEKAFSCLKYRGKSSYLMKVMEQFELCYQVPLTCPKSQVNYLIPDLLPTELKRNPKLNNGIEFIYKYDGYMPPELMARFIVKSHTLQRPNKRWRYGVLLQSTAFDSQALVTVDKEEREIKVIVCGGEQRSFLGAIRSMFDEIHKSYLTENIGLETFLPLKCERTGRKALLPYKTLVKKQLRIWQGHENDNQFDYTLEIYYSVSELLEGIESKQKLKEEFEKSQGATVNNINVTASPVITQSVNQDSQQSSQQHNSQSTAVSISIQLKTFSSQLKDWGEDIVDDLSESHQITNNPELEKLLPRAKKEIERMDSALNEIESVTNEAEAEQKLSKFAKVQTFIEDCIQGTNKVGELMQKAEEGVGKLQSLGKEYNKIATNFGFLAIPPFLLGE